MLPTIEVKVGELLINAIVRIGFARSKREARYFIQAGAVRLGRRKMVDPKDYRKCKFCGNPHAIVNDGFIDCFKCGNLYKDPQLTSEGDQHAEET